MTLGEKISKLRKEDNYTQEQLADILDVSRQSVSKWESDLAYPETEKLLKLSEVFSCSLDYLFKDDYENKLDEARYEGASDIINFLKSRPHEKKSDKLIFGMPAYHIAKNAKGFVAIGVNAEGFIAVGVKAKGVISLGVLALGLFSLGTVSLGAISCGMLSLGIIAAGSIAAGLFATGAIAFGIIAVGAIAIGDFGLGALVRAKYFGYGGNVKAMIAYGKSFAEGELFTKMEEITKTDKAEMSRLLDTVVPKYLELAKTLVQHRLK